MRLRAVALVLSLLAPVACGQAEDLVWLATPTAIRLSVPFAVPGALPEDAGTVLHTTFNGTAITDSKGVTWTRVGTPPQSSVSPFSGLGAAGPFTDSDYYTLPANNAINFAADHTLCIRAQANVASGSPVPLTNLGSQNGFMVEHVNPRIGLRQGGTYTLNTMSTNVGTVGGLTSICFTREGSAFRQTRDRAAFDTFAPGGTPGAYTDAASYLGRYSSAGSSWNGSIYEVWATTAPTSADGLVTLSNRMHGLLTAEEEPVYFLRDDVGRWASGSALFVAPKSVPRIGSNGIIVEPNSTNLFLNATAPVTQTMSGVYNGTTWCGWMEGTGSVELTAGTVVATGLPCTITATAADCSCRIPVQTTGTIVATVTGSPTRVQFEPGASRTGFMPSAGTAASRQYSDRVRVHANGALGGRSGDIAFDVTPSWGATGATTDRVVLSDAPLLGAAAAAKATITFLQASRVWRGSVNGTTASSVAQTFNAGETQALRLRYRAGGGACITVNGTETCSGTVSEFTGNPMVNLGTDGNTGAAVAVKNVIGRRGTGATATSVALLGDSITFGYGVTTSPARALQTTLGATWYVDNHGISGQSTPGSITQWRRDIKGFRYSYLRVLAGTNDLRAGTSGATVWANLQTILTDARAQGLTVYPVTILPRNGSSGWTAGMETERLAVNTSMLAWCTANGVTCIDGSTDFDDGAQAMKAAWRQADLLHPNQAGANELAALDAAAIQNTTCSAGAIAAPCVCGSVAIGTGYCCSGAWQATSCP